MADIAKFAIALEDLVTPAASKARSSVNSLSADLRKAKTDLAGYQGQLNLAKQLGDVEGYRKYSALVQQGKASVFGLAQQLEGTKAPAGGLSSAFASLGPYAAAASAAIAGATVAIAGFAAVVGKGIAMALEEGHANRMIVASFDALGGGVKDNGKKVLEVIDELETKLPQGQAQLANWAKAIQASGVTDLGQLKAQLVATASAQAIMGDEGANAYRKLQERVQLAVEAHHGLKLSEKSLTALYKAGLNQADVAKRMGMTTQQLSAGLKAGTIDAKKFGDVMTQSLTEKGKAPLTEMMSSIGVLGEKFMKVVGDLFEDVDTKPLTDGLASVISLLDAGKPSGAAMKDGVTGGLNAIIRLLGVAITEASVFFLDLEIKGLKAYIALKPLIGAVEKISGALGKIDSAVGSAEAAVGLKEGTTKGAAVDTAAGAAGRSVVGGLLGPMGTIGSLVLDVVSAIGGAQAQEIAKAQGVAIGQATVEGIKEGTETHSPSRAAMRIGAGMAQGLGMGMVQDPAPARAARTISANALGGLAGGGAFGAAGGANDNATSVGPFIININAPEGVTDATELSIVGLSAALERFQIGSGR